MVLGHYGLALAAKRLAPKTSLGSLVLAAQLADEVWPILLLLGVEHAEVRPAHQATLRLSFVDYPITHSLLTGVLGGFLFGVIYFFIRRNARGALITALLVPSHWVLDLLVHLPDLPIWLGGPKVGFGLWRSVPVTITLESVFFVGGLLIYLRSTVAKDQLGRWALWGFVALLTLGYASSIAGPPPRDIRSIAYSALLLWLFVPWAYWIDAHRKFRLVEPKDPEAATTATHR
jgi:hypothetical protein